MAAKKKTKRKAKPKITRKAAFLAAYRATASITRAAAAAKISRSVHYCWLERDADYEEQFYAADREAAQIIEDEAIRRAVEGWDKPVIYQGELSYTWNPKTRRKSTKPLTVRHFSDSILLALLKGSKPEKYKDRQAVEHSGPGGGPIRVHQQRKAVKLAELLSPDELSTIRTRLSDHLRGDRGGNPDPAAK